MVFIFAGKFYKNIIIDSIKEQEFIVNKSFTNFINCKKNKLKDYHKLFPVESKDFNSIRIYEQSLKSEFADYKNLNVKNIFYNDYQLNILFQTHFKTANDDQEFFIDNFNSDCNITIEKLNNDIATYNMKIISFPSNFFAKKNGFKKLVFFPIKYGQKNLDPLEKTNREKWIETGDKKYLNL